jgi:hypothetical protein
MSNYQSIVPNQLVQATLTTSASAALYTVPANSRTIVKDIQIVNQSTSSSNTITATVYFIPSGGTVNVNNAFLEAQAVVGGTPYHWVGTQILPTGATIQALSSAAANLFISGGEAT